MSALYAGSDWSGDPYRADEPFIFCVVALPDVEALNESCERLSGKLRMAMNEEFHGHAMKSDLQRLELLRAGQELGMRVGAIIVRTPSKTPDNWSYETLALELLTHLLPKFAFRSLWCDMEIQGGRARAFETEVKRRHREIYPSEHPKVRVRDSKTIRLIQLADVMAYALRTQTRNTVESPELVEFLREIIKDEANLILYR